MLGSKPVAYPFVSTPTLYLFVQSIFLNSLFSVEFLYLLRSLILIKVTCYAEVIPLYACFMPSSSKPHSHAEFFLFQNLFSWVCALWPFTFILRNSVKPLVSCWVTLYQATASCCLQFSNTCLILSILVVFEANFSYCIYFLSFILSLCFHQTTASCDFRLFKVCACCCT